MVVYGSGVVVGAIEEDADGEAEMNAVSVISTVSLALEGKTTSLLLHDEIKKQDIAINDNVKRILLNLIIFIALPYQFSASLADSLIGIELSGVA